MPDVKKFDLSPSISILLAGGLIAGAILFTNYYPSGQVVAPVDAAGNVSAVSIRPPSANEHIIGSPNAPVVLVEYSDFQCPYCSLIHPTLKRIVEESKGEIAWVYRHFPLESIHPEAQPAAIASECIAEQLGNAGFWGFADKIFANQKNISSSYYAQIAKELGADSATFAICVASGKYDARISTDYNEATQNGGNGTPFTVAVSGGKQVPFSGALPYAQIMAVIQSLKSRQ